MFCLCFDFFFFFCQGQEDAASAAAASAAPPLPGNPAASSAVDASHARIVAARETSAAESDAVETKTGSGTGSGVSQSVVPEEYHVVKSRGVLGLEYHDDRYTAQPIDHEAHLTQFPSLKPAGRAEVKQLRKVR